jgi:hypothetical protein
MRNSPHKITGANAGGPRRIPVRARLAARIAQSCRSMKLRVPLVLLLALLLVGGCAAPGQCEETHCGCVTEFDPATATDLGAASWGGQARLRAFSTNKGAGFLDEYVFGKYRGPVD